MPHNHPVCLGRPLPFPFTDVGIYYLIDAKLLPLTLMHGITSESHIFNQPV